MLREMKQLSKEFDQLYNKLCRNHAIAGVNYIKHFDLEVLVRKAWSRLNNDKQDIISKEKSRNL